MISAEPKRPTDEPFMLDLVNGSADHGHMSFITTRLRSLAAQYVSVASATFITGCCTSGLTSEPKFSVANVSAPQEVAGSKILLIADTHASNPHAAFAAKSVSAFVDRWISKYAKRPPHVDVWGSRLLEWVLDRERDVGMVLHLGDAGNISCTGEFERFVGSMKKSPRPWFMAPGNHDSTFMGNFALIDASIATPKNWSGECSNGNKPWGQTSNNGTMIKTVFIERYLAAKGWAKASSGIDFVPNDGTPIERVRYEVVEKSPYASYIIQQVATGPDTMVILLDTTQFRERPSVVLGRPAGSVGGLQENQLETLESWLKAEASTRRRAVVLASHYPIFALDSSTKKRLLEIIQHYSIASFIGAHTHDPTESRIHLWGSEQSKKFLEINVGSVVDWPMEYAVLQMSKIASTNDSVRHQFGITAHSIAFQLDAQSCAKQEGIWKIPQTDIPNYYTSYVGPQAYSILLQNMYTRLRKDLTTNPIPDDLVAQETDRIDYINDDTLAEYERCQARWASEAEYRTVNTLPSQTTKEGPKEIVTEQIREDNKASGTHSWILEAAIEH